MLVKKIFASSLDIRESLRIKPYGSNTCQQKIIKEIRSDMIRQFKPITLRKAHLSCRDEVSVFSPVIVVKLHNTCPYNQPFTQYRLKPALSWFNDIFPKKKISAVEPLMEIRWPGRPISTKVKV